MPVRDRRYEHVLHSILGGLIMLAVMYEVVAWLVGRCAAIAQYFMAARGTQA